MRRQWLIAFVVLPLVSLGWLTVERSNAAPAHVSRIVYSQGEKIWVLDGDGGNKRFLVRGESPEISPDGHWVAYYRCNACALFLINADGGPARRLAGRGFGPPTWSPDSRHLATTSSVSGPYLVSGPTEDEQLTTIDRVTGKQHRIAVAPQVLGSSFSPDGTQLTFSMSSSDELRSDVYVSAWDGGALRRLTWDDRSSRPLWAPNGSIDFSHREGPLGERSNNDPLWGKHRIWRISRDGTGRRVLTAQLTPAITDDRTGLIAAVWSRDGKTLLAVSPTHGGDLLYLVDRAGSIRSLGDDGDVGGSRSASVISLSTDGRFVLVVLLVNGPISSTGRLEVLPVDDGTPHVIAGNVSGASWSR